jgi:hypothetical protein
MSVHRVEGHYVDIDDELIPEDRRILYLAGFRDGVAAERYQHGINQSLPLRVTSTRHQAVWDRHSGSPPMCRDCSVPIVMTADGWMHVPEEPA